MMPPPALALQLNFCVFCFALFPSAIFPPSQQPGIIKGGRFSAFRTVLLLRFSMICCCCSRINYSANQRVPGACHKSSVGAGQAFLTSPAPLSGAAPAAPLAGKQTNPQPSWLGTCWKRRKIQYCHSQVRGVAGGVSQGQSCLSDPATSCWVCASQDSR